MLRPFRMIAPFLLAACGLLAQGPGRLPVRHYGNEEGLLSEVVTSMAQTTDGLLWAGTEAGLVYFGGHHFLPYAGPLPSPVLTDLFADQDGSLWVATDAGLAQVSGLRSRSLGPAEGLAKGSFHKVGRDALGHLWAFGADTLFVENGPMRFVRAPALPVPEAPVQMFADPSQREALVITSRHILAWSGDRWRILETPPIGPKEEFLNLARDGEGGIWVRSTAALWQQPPAGAWRRERANMSGGFSFSSRLDRDAQGCIWFDDADGLWRITGSRREKFGRPEDDAKGGLVDSEGGIWIRSDHGVIRTLGQSRWAGYDTREGLATNLVWQPLRDHRGVLWVATDKGLCVATEGGFRKVIPGRILALALAPDGHLWAAGSPGGTVFEIDTATRTWKTHTVDVLPKGRICAGLAVDAEGTPWVADRTEGLAKGTRAGAGWTWSREPVLGAAPRQILAVQALPGNGLVIIHDGTATLLRDGKWSPVPDLLPETPGALAIGPQGRLAFSYRNVPDVTLQRLEGDRVVTTGTFSLRIQNEGLFSIFSLGMDPAGRIWVGTNVGLGVLTGTDASTFHMLGMEDRRISPECNEGSILVEPGRIWLGTTSGLASFSSNLPPAGQGLKEPIVTAASAGTLALDPLGPAPGLPREHNELDLQFMVPTYQAASRICYEARLLGVDPGWVRLDEPKVRYAGLRSGRHTLLLRGTLAGLAEGPVLAFHFSVIPAWWETAWAQALALLALAGGSWLIFWLRHLALRARNRQLQAEVALQTRALQDASKAKSAFLANMSHELRTPLNAILLYSELLQEEAGEKGLPSTLEDAAKISQAGSSLLKLIDDILDISKIEAGHMRVDLEDIETGPFLARLDSALRPVVERKGNAFVVEDLGRVPVLRSDATRLQQILANLLGNAAKFTENGKVTLRLYAEAGFAVFEVEDSGIGMTPDEQRKVFSEFVQADSSTTRKYGGTGLGLTLVLRLTEILGGRVGLTSQPGLGTCVAVRLPCGDGPPPPEAEPVR